MRAGLTSESPRPRFSLITNRTCLMCSDRARSGDLTDHVCLKRGQFRQRHAFNVRYRIILCHVVVPLRFHSCSADLKAGSTKR
jgi:hypothetical protein